MAEPMTVMTGLLATAAHHEVAHFFNYGPFELTYFTESPFLGRSGLVGHVFFVPIGSIVARPKFPKLPGEVLVMQMQPVVFGQFALHDLIVVNDRVGNFSVGEGQGYGIVPRLFGFG